MVDILINLINDMKVCLALALGAGFVFGYIYSKLKARETHQPLINELKKNIYEQKEKSNTLLTQINEDKEMIKNYDDELHGGNLTNTKFKSIISELEIKKAKLEKDDANLKNQYTKQENIFTDYNNEIITLKSVLGIEETAQIDNHKRTLKEDITKKAEIYKQKCDSSEGLQKEDKELMRETSDLSSQISSLTAALNKKEDLLLDCAKNTSSLRLKLQKEYDTIIKNKEEDDSKIESFKKQLLAIKEKLSS